MARCPVCEATLDAEVSRAMPFCSERCRTIDLRRWLHEQYALPVDPGEEEEEGFDEGLDGLEELN